MAERNIGLRLQLNGVNLAIKNVKQLEEELNLAKQDLKELEIGSNLFKDLANEISNAEGQLQKLNQQAAGITIEKQLQGIGKFTGGITASFAAATAAVQLFGIESEDVTKAAAQAQNILSLAISARAIEEGILGARIIATTIAQKAQTAATLATNTAMKALFATIAANPIGALLTAITLVVVGIIALIKFTNNATLSQEEFNKQVEIGNKILQESSSLIAKYNRSISDLAERLTLEGATVQEIFEATRNLRQLQVDAARDRLIQLNDEIDRLEKLGATEEQLKEIKEERIQLANTFSELVTKQQNEEIRNNERLLEVERTNQRRRIALLNDGLQKRLKELRLTYEQERKQAEKNGEDVLLVDRKFYKERANIIKQSKDEVIKLTQEIADELAAIENSSFNVRQGQILKDFRLRKKQIEDLITDLKNAGQLTEDVANQLNQSLENNFEIAASKLGDLFLNILNDGLKARLEVANQLKLLSGIQINTEEQLFQIREQIFRSEFELFKEKEIDKLKSLFESAELEKDQIDALLKEYENFYLILQELQFNNSENILKFSNLEKEETMEKLELEEMYYFGITQLQEKFLNNDKTLKQKIKNQELLFQLDLLNIQRKALEEKLKILEKDPTLNPQELQRIKTELLKIEVDTNNKIKEINQNNVEIIKQNNQDILNSISTSLQQFTSILGQTATLFANTIEVQFLALENSTKTALNSVVGNTEESEKKRLEIQQIYEERRKQLTKQGQIAQLQLSRAQAIANVAEAVTKALTEGPIIGQILAGVSAGLGLIQVGVISQQIGQVRSLQGGGMVRGASHSQGGVSFARGGVELEGNESVINRRSTLNYGGLLDTINQSGGGRPIRIESAMDSRMIEVLASQKTQPIRAYVIEQDITKSQAINRRLEELASF